MINALQRGLRHEQGWTDLGNASQVVEPRFDGRGSETVIEKDCGAKNAASHLLDLNWEVFVVDQPAIINAECLPGGKIVVYTGLLKHYKSDAEVALIIGHEVGHAVARQAAEVLSKTMLVQLLSKVLYHHFWPDFVNRLSIPLLRLPRSISCRMELEADHIGLLLAASAGYDPRVAPTLYEKTDKLAAECGDAVWKDYLAAYPPAKKRAKMLARALEEALTIYCDVRAGRGVKGCL